MIDLNNIENINLHKCSISELKLIAQQIRNRIIDIVSNNGGHLAPSLGVVELTLALHSTFNSPEDKIIWDVGHQSYAHKILTGRNKEFNTLRKYGGISGFPKRSESEHDIFNVGHSSTSISAALGIAAARDLENGDNKVIAVIGDGALTGGMSFEALNNAGHLNKDLIVILNDNEMSISHNVGALSEYLNRIRTEPVYSKGKKEIENILLKLPSIGNKLFKAADRIKDSLKYLLVPGILFEELGFKYLGPIDGHNIEKTRDVLERTKLLKGPILIHVLTKKGKGYLPAEKNPGKFHGVGPFNKVTGEAIKKSTATFTNIFANKLIELAHTNNKIVAITAAMPTGTGLNLFAEEFPKRFFDVGIAEQHAVTFAAGLAVQKFKPVVALYSTFLQRAYDQVIHDVCMQNLPVIIAIDRAGLVGEDGETHHGIFDLTFLRPIPNLTIVAPKDENELELMLEYSVESNFPIAIRYPKCKVLGEKKLNNIKPIEYGKAELIRNGKDALLISFGPTIYTCLEVCNRLSSLGIECSLINIRFIKPLDKELITNYIKKSKIVFTIEEHVLDGGFGSAVEEIMLEEGINVNIKKIGLPNKFITHGNIEILRNKYGLDADNIFNTIKKFLDSK